MKTGIHFERCNCRTATAHNKREEQYLEGLERSGKKTYDIFQDRTSQNLSWTNPAYEGKSLEEILDDCRDCYRRHVGQKPQEDERVRTITDKKTGLKMTVKTAGWAPIREGVCPVKASTTIADFFAFIHWLEKRGIHVISIYIHRDEGYEDPVTGTRKYNYHAHIIADWMDYTTGRTAKLHQEDFSEMQKALAESLQMECGVPKKVTGARHLTPSEQREKAAAEHAIELQSRNVELEKEKRALEETLRSGRENYKSGLRDICRAYQSQGRADVNLYDQIQSDGMKIGALKPQPEEQKVRDDLEEHSAIDVSSMDVEALMREQTILHDLIIRMLNAIKNIWRQIANSIKEHFALLPKESLERELHLQAEKDAAVLEMNKALVVAKEAIKERDHLKEEKAQWANEKESWLRDFRNIADTLVNKSTPDQILKYESQGIHKMIGPQIWADAKSKKEAQSKSLNNGQSRGGGIKISRR